MPKLTARFLIGVEEAVQMDDKIAHVRIVHRRLGLGAPCRLGRLVVREDADDVELIEISELYAVQFLELATEHEVKQLFPGVLFGHSNLIRR